MVGYKGIRRGQPDLISSAKAKVGKSGPHLSATAMGKTVDH